MQNHVYRHALDQQWESLGRGGGGGGGGDGGGRGNGTSSSSSKLTWADYQSMVNPAGRRDRRARRRAERDRRRWRRADADADDALTKHEFKLFLFPQLSAEDAGAAVLVPEAHADLDTDLDGRVSLDEFMAVHRDDDDGDEDSDDKVAEEEDLKAVEDYFRETLDADGSGFVDVVELSEWVEPTGFVLAKSEVVYLMRRLDADGDKVLGRREVLEDAGAFLRSQVTFFGKLYRLLNLREEVFQIQKQEKTRD